MGIICQNNPPVCGRRMICELYSGSCAHCPPPMDHNTESSGTYSVLGIIQCSSLNWDKLEGRNEGDWGGLARYETSPAGSVNGILQW